MVCRRASHVAQFRRMQQDFRVAAFQLDRQLIDIMIAPAEAGGQRQGNGPGADIDGAEEQRSEIRACFRNQRHTVLGADARVDHASGGFQRILPQGAIGIGARQLAAHIVKIQAALAGCGIIERFPQSAEIRKAPLQIVPRRGCNQVVHMSLNL